MEKKIVYRPSYISPEFAKNIQNYFHKINDGLHHSYGPYAFEQNKLGWQGCWDRQLHYELSDNPIHIVIKQLKKDFGDFSIFESSIRYLSAPFMPHSDIRNSKWLHDLRQKNIKEGFTFLIPLWWQNNYNPGTAFFSNPAKLDEPFYSDMLDVLPNFADSFQDQMKNFSVRQIIRWKSPGDLIAWENFQWHGSCHFGEANYDRANYVKEFISIETHRH